jgi:hypothetical protein
MAGKFKFRGIDPDPAFVGRKMENRVGLIPFPLLENIYVVPVIVIMIKF